MNNEPVAWMNPSQVLHGVIDARTYRLEGFIPLYTHPAKALTTELQALLDSVNGDYYLGKEKEEALVAQVRKQYSEPAKTLTDEELLNQWHLKDGIDIEDGDLIEFARAILKKASKK